ncbi:MAG: radical SAM protein [Firmicutes bacterium]|nr:radical SAM protein [Bacillota bacterium]
MRFSEKLNCFWLTLNRKCNLRCKWCYAQNTKFSETDDLSFDDACRAVTLACDYGFKRVALIGGEPLCWPNIIPLISFIKNKGMSCGLITNGVLLADKSYLQKLKNAGLSSVNISMKADTKKGYIETTEVDAFENTIEAIKNVSDLKINHTVSYVLTHENIDNLLNGLTVAKNAGAKSYYLSFCNPYYSENKFKHDCKNIKNLINKFINLYEYIEGLDINYRFHQTLPECIWPEGVLQNLIDKNRLVSACQVHKKCGLVFDSKLQVIICNSLFDYPIGKFGVDFNNASELDSFLKSEKITNIYKKLLLAPSNKCKDCDKFTYCAGGCILQWYSYSFNELVNSCSCVN